jgi:hypothetical protein
VLPAATPTTHKFAATATTSYYSTWTIGGNTGWCLSTTEADLFAVWLTSGNIVHGEPKKNNFYF